MKNRTEIIGIGFAERIRQFLRTYQAVPEFFLCALLGFFSSNAFLFQNIAPFGVGLVAAGKRDTLPACTAGALLGYVFSFGTNPTMKYLGAVIIAAALRFLFGSVNSRFSLILHSLYAFFAVAVTSLTVASIGGLSIYEAVLGCSEAALAAGFSYFFERTRIILERKEKNGFELSEWCCIIISASVFLLSISNIKIFQLSLGRTAAVFLVLFFSCYAGQMYSTAIGITVGAVLGLAGPEYGFLIGAYGLGGLISGIFSSFGKLAVACSFIAVNGVTVLFSAQTDAVYIFLCEVFAASVLFLLVPAGYGDRLKSIFIPRVQPDGESMKSILLTRLFFAQNALKDIAETTQKISDKLASLSERDPESICSQICQKTCQRCGLNSFCWQNSYNDTVSVFHSLYKTYCAGKSISKEDLPPYFLQRCCRPETLIENAGQIFTEEAVREGTRHKVAQVRSVVTDQFDGMSVMLSDMAQELETVTQADQRFSSRIQELLEKIPVQPQSVLCYRDRQGRLTVDITLPIYQQKRIEEEELTLKLSDICRRDLERPMITETEDRVRYRFAQKASLAVSFACSQLCAGGGTVCGDTSQFFIGPDFHAVMILSDGMGSGPRAAVDSVMASGLLSRLIMAGIGFEAALKIVNSALLIKSGEESIATLDVASIDLYTGRVQFLKAGAAPAYLKKSGRIGRVESASLPIGILKGVSFESSSVTLSEGDFIVLISDGVIMESSDWISSEIAGFSFTQPKELADHLAETARSRLKDGHEDDITVMVAMLKENA